MNNAYVFKYLGCKKLFRNFFLEFQKLILRKIHFLIQKVADIETTIVQQKETLNVQLNQILLELKKLMI